MEEMEKSHEAFFQGAQMELKKEMALLQKKIMMDTVSIFAIFFEFVLAFEDFTLLILFCIFLIATTGNGHCEEVPPVHVVLKFFSFGRLL